MSAPAPILSEIDLDGDLVTLTHAGRSIQVYACDFVDTVHAMIVELDADPERPLPGWTDPETLETRPGTHGRGNEWVGILRSELSRIGLDVQPNRALAIYAALVRKAEQYRSFFENGPSSRPSLDAPHPVSLADAQLSGLPLPPDEKSAPPTG